MRLNRDKQGQALTGLVTFSAVAIAFVLIVGVFLYVFGVVSSSLTNPEVVTTNGINISNYSDQTVGKVNTAFLNSADIIGILFIFGMIIALFFSGYMMRESTMVLFFVVDFILLLFAYILAVYISNGYESILLSLPFQSLIVSNLGNTSKIMLLLPKIVLVAGAITMILTYSGIPKSQEEQVAGF